MSSLLLLLHCFLLICFSSSLLLPSSVRHHLLILTPSDLSTIIFDHKCVLLFYYDPRDPKSHSFLPEFFKLAEEMSEAKEDAVTPGILEITETTKGPKLVSHPHVKLIIEGVEFDYEQGHIRDWASKDEIKQWTKYILANGGFRAGLKAKEIKSSDVLNGNLKKNSVKIVYCKPNRTLEDPKYLGKKDYSDLMGKLATGFVHKEAIFLIYEGMDGICRDHMNKMLIYCRHLAHEPKIVDPELANRREIINLIKNRIHPHVLRSNDTDFLSKINYLHKPLLVLFVDEEVENPLLLNIYTQITDNHELIDHFQFGVVSNKDYSGQILLQNFGITKEKLPFLFFAENVDNQARKYIFDLKKTLINLNIKVNEQYNKTEGINKFETHLRRLGEEGISEVFAEMNRFAHNCKAGQVDEHRHIKMKVNHNVQEQQKRMLHSHSFNDSIQENGATFVLFYYRTFKFNNDLQLVEKIIEHMSTEYGVKISFKLFDLFYNEIDNIGYYNVKSMPLLYLYKTPELFFDLTDFLRTQDVTNILYLVERQLETPRIGYHSPKVIMDSLNIKSQP